MATARDQRNPPTDGSPSPVQGKEAGTGGHPAPVPGSDGAGIGELSAAASRRLWVTILGVSALVVIFLFWLIYFKPVAETALPWVGYLPQVNAGLNFTSFCLVLAGLRAIGRRDRKRHGWLMASAVSVSGLFLVSYLIYHFQAGHTTYTGQGWVRPIYFFILVSHILLSVVLVPLLLGTVSLAAMRKFSHHRALARWTYPIWLYVSLTGVLVFLFLRVWS